MREGGEGCAATFKCLQLIGMYSVQRNVREAYDCGIKWDSKGLERIEMGCLVWWGRPSQAPLLTFPPLPSPSIFETTSPTQVLGLKQLVPEALEMMLWQLRLLRLQRAQTACVLAPPPHSISPPL